jgi:serine/threonine-protein kinase
MATVYYGRRTGDAQNGPTVAIKRVHPHLSRDRRFSSMFIDEARLVSRIQHPNVIRTLDIIASDDECLLVMEYVHGESLSRLLKLVAARGLTPRLDVLSAVVCDALEGLEAAHEATNAAGAPLNLVHRDISPQNILVGADGRARVLDFGVAKAAGSLHVTRDGEIKGKLAYMSPEQVSAQPLDRRTDVYAAGVILWEAVTQQPLFDGDNEAAIIAAVLRQDIPVPSSLVPDIHPELDAVILRALAAAPDDRYPTALAMARALEGVLPRARAEDVAAWVDSLAGDALRERSVTMERGGSGARHAPTKAVTEVFFRAGAGEPGSRGDGTRSGDTRTVNRDVPTRVSVVVERGVANLDEGMREAVAQLPVNVRGPIEKYRWWLAGAAGAIVVSLGYCALRPAPVPETNVTGAPGSLGAK